MKKLFYILICIILTTTPIFANNEEAEDNAVYLNLSNPKDELNLNISKPQKFNTEKIDLKKSQKHNYNVTSQSLYENSIRDPYKKQTASYTHEKKYGNFSFGTKYDSTFNPDNYSQTSTMFTKYSKNKFSVSTAYKNNSFASWSDRGKGTFSFSPEYKLNSHVTLQNIYSTNFLDKNRKNELLFSINPFKDDRMNFDVGAGQIYSETDSAPVRSQLKFSTKFRF